MANFDGLAQMALNREEKAKAGTENVLELDKTRKALEGLKNNIQDTPIDTVMLTLRSEFDKDMAELGHPAEAKDWAKQIEKQVREAAPLGTSEFANLDKFVDPKNFNGLEKLIKEKGSDTSFLSKILSYFGISSATASWLPDVLNFFAEMTQTESGADTATGKFLRKLAGKAKGEAKEGSEAMAQLAAAWVAKFNAAGGLTLNPASVTQLNLGELAKEGFKDEGDKKTLTALADAALAEKGHLAQLYKEIKAYESGTVKFEFQLTDVLFQTVVSPKHIGVLAAAIRGDKDSPYALKSADRAGIRAFLNAALTMKKDEGGAFERALESFKKPASAPAAPAVAAAVPPAAPASVPPTVPATPGSAAPTNPETPT